MATRPKGYGLSRELADKVAAKYSVEDEQGNVLCRRLASRAKFHFVTLEMQISPSLL